MAKLNTKNMTPAELKALKKELEISLKALNGSVKLMNGEASVAVKADTKAHNELAKALTVAQKTYDAAAKALLKQIAVRAKGTGAAMAKLCVQIQQHELKLSQVAAASKTPEETTAG